LKWVEGGDWGLEMSLMSRSRNNVPSRFLILLFITLV